MYSIPNYILFLFIKRKINKEKEQKKLKHFIYWKTFELENQMDMHIL